MIAPGNYDGVHLGHRALIRSAQRFALANGLLTSVLTFDPHPGTFLGAAEKPVITKQARRAELLQAAGADRVFVQHFTHEFAALSPDRLANLRLKFHPSMILLTSRFPVVSIWDTQRHDSDGTIRNWKPESALVVRPRLHVEVWRLSTGGHKFFAALASGRSIAEAITEAAADADFDLADALSTLISSQAVVAIEPR